MIHFFTVTFNQYNAFLHCENYVQDENEINYIFKYITMNCF